MKLGCFGSLLTLDAEDKYCQRCNEFGSCKQEVQVRVHELRKTMDVDNYITKHIDEEEAFEIVKPKKRDLTEEEIEIIENKDTPVKSRELLSSVFRKGMSIRYLRMIVGREENPFEGKTPAKLKVAFDVLLSKKFTRGDMQMALISDNYSSMNLGTARSQSAIICSAFKIAGLIEEIGEGQYELSL